MQLKSKSWDSSFFNKNIGEALNTESEIELAEFKEKSKDFELVYLLSDTPLKQFDGYYFDEKVVFEKKPHGLSVTKNRIEELDNPTDQEISLLYQLAILSGKYSRYNMDPNFPKPLFTKLYETWIDNTLNKTFGFKLFVIYFEDQMAGFITLNKVDSLTMEIGLISVFENFQGLGLAKDMVNFVSNLCIEMGYTTLLVATQRINGAAIKLYESAGFNFKNATFIYHIWN